MKGLYWLILGLCVWFIPTIIFQILVTSFDSSKTAEEVVSEIPSFFVVILFGASLPLILKGVLSIRKERKKASKEANKEKKRKKK